MPAAKLSFILAGTLHFFLFLVFDQVRAQSPDPKLIEGAKKEGQMVF
jgi:hypothetical protein